MTALLRLLFVLHLRAAAFLLLLAGSTAASAQYENLKFYDNTYVDYIKTVRLNVNGFPHTYPMISLGGGARLRLSFDDLSDEVIRYSYKFIHCNQDWQPSNLSPLEYNSGYSVDYLQEYDFSLRTLKNYVHYDLVFPNDNMRLEASGNYLLVVYNAEDEEVPVITRRFMVQEDLAGVSGIVTRPPIVDLIHSHQEVDLVVNTEQMNLRAPLQELSATITQNYRWDNAVTHIEPNFLSREGVRFDYQGKIVFRGMNEFRNLDIRSVQAPRTATASITTEEDYYAMMLMPEKPRGYGTYLNYFDLNGDFVNFRFDRAKVNLADEFLQQNFQRFNVDFNGEYIQTTFVLDTGGERDGDIYLNGGFTEYQLKPQYKMVWNPSINMYVGRTLLKQGFYNYHYVEVDPGKKIDPKKPSAILDYRYTEGLYDETENDYLALIYWRPMGGRYDRLVGSVQLNSSLR